uniref:Putative ovule protein n=1 Tax=Solanum chacoense TaxID=4108 RepID=A0A0V0H5H1_SOLCH
MRIHPITHTCLKVVPYLHLFHFSFFFQWYKVFSSILTFSLFLSFYVFFLKCNNKIWVKRYPIKSKSSAQILKKKKGKISIGSLIFWLRMS